MDAERWTADQRSLREVLRAQRGPSIDPSRLTPQDRDPGSLASVIVVCWNSADVLGRCLGQLLAQDYPNREIIVVDDGSTDRTVEVAEELAARGSVTILRSLANRGCPHARNLGLRRAGGEIIAFIDADGFAAPSWLSEIVRAFDLDASIGAVASTVFFAGDPLVVNGAGGTVNRQGWAADLSMNESFEHAQLASEALYPMGCGMAMRREAIDRVGDFDDRMLNYYDDVDYGMRLWRAGYRVVVAPDAWIDHGFGGSAGDSSYKRLLCERHRVRVVLKHAPASSLGRWAGYEARAIARARRGERKLKLRAILWNVRCLASTLASRWRLRAAPRVPQRLVDPSWGDGFPAGVASLPRPRPSRAGPRIDMADPSSEGQLLYGWFPPEHVDGLSYRWAGVWAGAMVRLGAPARRLQIHYAHAPVDIGGVDVRIRRPGSSDPLAVVWSTRLSWQYTARSVENHPLELPAGDYEVLFAAGRGWSNPPHDARSLGFSLSSMHFEESYEIGSGGLDMSSPTVDEQLVCGWFEPEQSEQRTYRWSGGHSAALVRVAASAVAVQLHYRMPPGTIGVLNVSLRALGATDPVWSTRIDWLDSDWREESFPLHLAAGDYVVFFDAEETWSNPGQRDRELSPENRSLGFALSRLSFADAASDRS